ncbi:unnamed protein product [Porites evermanni]|uniref:Uncharacterized protein n=1 Tax=Porites evermanni TaxID=104178 RepID=A0ABN8SEA0_9CNID|nr:unnamed protein product [Porites evermanni]
MRATLLSFAVFFVLVDQFALSNAGNCTLYSPPKNGALVCNYIGSDPTCQVQCKQGYDFEFTPPLVYYCSEGEWKFLSFFYYEARFPWPNCKSKCD